MKTQLFDWHAKYGDIINFAGFKMPVMYSTIKEEHMAVRNDAGIFDVSHMGRMWIEGEDSEKFLNFLVPRDLRKTTEGRASYTFMLNEKGGFKDDLVFERLSKEKWLLVWNAGNLRKIDLWMRTVLLLLNQTSNLDVRINNIASTSSMFALQGPKAKNVLIKASGGLFDPPSPWNIIATDLSDEEVIISGTGYTGESGYEIIVLNTSNSDPHKAVKVWEFLMETGANEGLKPCGLGARDSLRLEAGYCLYGNDINENINPIEADLFFPPFIHMEKPFFIGKSELEHLQEHKPNRSRVGIIALKKGPSPRPRLKLLKNGEEIGIVTSGGFSPLLQLGVGMGYVSLDYQDLGTLIQFEARGKPYEAKIAKFPLYDQEKFGGKRKI